MMFGSDRQWFWLSVWATIGAFVFVLLALATLGAVVYVTYRGLGAILGWGS